MRVDDQDEHHDSTSEDSGSEVFEKAYAHLSSLIKPEQGYGNRREGNHGIDLPSSCISDDKCDHVRDDSTDDAKDRRYECQKTTAYRELIPSFLGDTLSGQCALEKSLIAARSTDFWDDVIDGYLVDSLHDVERVDDEPMYEYVDDCEKHDVFHSRKGRSRVNTLTDFHQLHQHEECKDGLRNGNDGCLMDGFHKFIGINAKQGIERRCEHVGTADFQCNVIVQVESPT